MTASISMDLAEFLGIDVDDLQLIKSSGVSPSNLLLNFLGETEGATATNLRDANDQTRAHLGGDDNDTVLVLACGRLHLKH